MSDQGFEFGPPPPRREARQFEPPPWERGQFEQRKREEAEREAAAEAARAAVQAQQEAAKETEGAAEPSAAQPSAGASDEGPRAAEGDVLQAVAAPAGPHAEVDEKQVALMMIDLRAEEPPALEGAWAVNVTAGVVVAMVGVASAIWGAAALARKGMPAAGTLGGLLLLGFGLGFLGLGSWLIFKALRQRGVL